MISHDLPHGYEGHLYIGARMVEEQEFSVIANW